MRWDLSHRFLWIQQLRFNWGDWRRRKARERTKEVLQCDGVLTVGSEGWSTVGIYSEGSHWKISEGHREKGRPDVDLQCDELMTIDQIRSTVDICCKFELSDFIEIQRKIKFYENTKEKGVQGKVFFYVFSARLRGCGPVKRMRRSRFKKKKANRNHSFQSKSQ